MNINTDIYNNIIITHKGKSLNFGNARHYTKTLFSSYLNILDEYFNSMDDETLERIFVIYSKLHNTLSLKETDPDKGFKELLRMYVGLLVKELNKEGMIESFLGKERINMFTEVNNDDSIYEFCDSYQALKLIELSILTRSLIPVFNMYIKFYYSINNKFRDGNGETPNVITTDYMLLHLLKDTHILDSDILQHLKFLLNKKFELLDLDGPNIVSKCVVIITIADIVTRILPLIDLNKKFPLFPVYKRIYYSEINASSISALFENTKLIG